MILAMVWNPNDPKLKPASYSQCYRDQFVSLMDRFEYKVNVIDDCSADDIEADVILFYDVHSSHHINIEGIDKHPALKLTYFNDPHQISYAIQYKTGEKAYKLGRKRRVERALKRGVDYIITPYTDAYYRFIAPYLGNKAEEMLLWYPISPDVGRFIGREKPLIERKTEVLANGASASVSWASYYEFRRWAYSQPYVSFVEHAMSNSDTPAGFSFSHLLTDYAGALALTELQTVPKYSEIPLSGCVCFAQYHKDYENMGFKDYESCIYVNKDNFEERVKDFLNHPEDYQKVADAGRTIIEEKYTADKFADYIYDFCWRQINDSR